MQEMSGLYMPVVSPNNFVSGAIKTVGCVTTGAMSTAACLLLIPAATTVSGYNNGGLLGGSVGFIGGTIAGAITGSLVAVTFTLQGVQQLVQGIFRTPGAIIGYLGGKDWDDLACEWVYTDLKEEANLFLNMTDEQFLKTVEKAGGIVTPLVSSAMTLALPILMKSLVKNVVAIALPPQQEQAQVGKTRRTRSKRK